MPPKTPSTRLALRDRRHSGRRLRRDFRHQGLRPELDRGPHSHRAQPGLLTNPAIPANDVGLSDFPIIGSAQFPQGNYNIAIAVDPTDPSVIYVGGTADGNETGLIRINLTNIWDAHSLVAYSDQANDGGNAEPGLYRAGHSRRPLVTLLEHKRQVLGKPSSYLNYIRGPQSPFVASATLNVFNYGQFTNNGNGVEWIPFDVGGTDYHRVVTMVDPTTGLARFIFGNDQGIWSVLDNNGTFETSIGSSDAEPVTSRNGNLQITQFYYGAAQPSNAAALIAGSLFYGSAQDNGGPSSKPASLATATLTTATSYGMGLVATPRAWPPTSKA